MKRVKEKGAVEIAAIHTRIPHGAKKMLALKHAEKDEDGNFIRNEKGEIKDKKESWLTHVLRSGDLPAHEVHGDAMKIIRIHEKHEAMALIHRDNLYQVDKARDAELNAVYEEWGVLNVK